MDLSPSVKQVSDFFIYLFQYLNRLPSTIDGYMTAIVDSLGLLTRPGIDPTVPRIYPSQTSMLSERSSPFEPLTQTSNI